MQKQVEQAVMVTTKHRGVLGLAVSGPNSNCKIGPAANIQLGDITAVAEVTPEAVKRWEDAPWRA